ncbi:hypothetical protein KIH39_05905 [Telmatocola sphagniphila]|uniref:Uncharacterized protein n=1 Tax=Telmatocola sphagniphila TaxID=1123043 RepID=A0A8E6EVZ9_9BACT|nr:hypothetical protein [Telmatocola sphagniphila]QVL33445.1 hypothetical protein KIH39_05905 [Telmatocola sphagniphila]
MRRFWLLFVAGTLFAGVGCSSSSDTKKKANKDSSTENRESSLAAYLDKPIDANSCKELLQNYIASLPEAKALKLKKAVAGLKESLTSIPALSLKPDAEFLISEEFVLADAIYLEENLLLREVEKNLQLSKLAPELRAKKAFEWVCRQVYIKNRPLQASMAAPAHITLQSGCGMPWDRSYTFLALLRHLDLEGFLLAPPELNKTMFLSGNAPNPASKSGPAPSSAPKVAPIWGVGVLIGKDMLIFDSQTGTQVMLAGGQPAKIQDLKKDGELVSRIIEPKRPFTLTSDQVRQSVPFIAAPLSSLAARMKFLDEDLKHELSLHRDVVAAMTKLKDAGFEPQIWNVPGDPANFCHLIQLLAINPPILDQIRSQVIPMEAFPRVFFTLESEQARGGPLKIFSNGFLKMHFNMDGNPEADPPIVQGLFRGSLNDTINKLLKLKDTAEAERQIIQKDPNLEKEVFKWCEAANQAYAALSRAERSNDASAKALAQGNIEQIFKASGRAMSLVSRVVFTMTSKDALYYVAMAVHEKAERLSLRALAEPGKISAALIKDAWKDSVDWWSRYLNYSVGGNELGNAAREAHANKLKEQATQLAESK